ELYGLTLGQWLAERHALLRIFADHLEAALSHAEPVRGLMNPIARDPGLRLAHALAFLAHQVLDWHLHVVERDLVGHITHHVIVLAHAGETRRIEVDEEDGEAAA